jgi:hypothetical protein
MASIDKAVGGRSISVSIWRRVPPVLALVAVLAAAAHPVAGVGESNCVGGGGQAGEIALSGSYIVGARAEIEGQQLPLCNFVFGATGSGSFHWAAIENVNPAWVNVGGNIVQVGYGRCVRTNNNLGLGTTCNGNYYWYWAWGTEGCGPADGSLPNYGPVPIRIGASLGSTPPDADYYVLRHTVNGTVYYDGYVNGSLLTGTNALGNQVTARVAASELCWDGNQQYRRLAWFGETFDNGDSMGGWAGSTKDHLDYDPLRYSVATGWLSTNLSAPNPCNGHAGPAAYTCKISSSDHIFIDTTR